MSLENTTWTISGVGDIVCNFKEKNVVTTTFQNGQSIDNNWGELDGAFAIELHKSTADHKKWQVFSGTYAGNISHGILYNFGVAGGPRHFTMTKNG